jgi:hypothetical protein
MIQWNYIMGEQWLWKRHCCPALVIFDFWWLYSLSISSAVSIEGLSIRMRSTLRVVSIGVLTDRIISDFIRDLIWKIMKIFRFVSVSGDIHIQIRIQNSFTDVDTVRPLPIRIRPFSYYSSISDIIWKYPIRYYPNKYPKYFYYIFFN